VLCAPRSRDREGPDHQQQEREALQQQHQPATSAEAAAAEAASIALIEEQNYAPLLQKIAAALPATVAPASTEGAYAIIFIS
jgi:hypothetical protein